MNIANFYDIYNLPTLNGIHIGIWIKYLRYICPRKRFCFVIFTKQITAPHFDADHGIWVKLVNTVKHFSMAKKDFSKLRYKPS